MIHLQFYQWTTSKKLNISVTIQISIIVKKGRIFSLLYVVYYTSLFYMYKRMSMYIEKILSSIHNMFSISSLYHREEFFIVRHRVML